MIELAILGLLDEQDLHGYELKKRLAELLGAVVERLVRIAVPGAGPPREGRARSRRSRPTRPTPAIPMTGALGGELAAFRARIGRPGHGGRPQRKKVYGITEAGPAPPRRAARPTAPTTTARSPCGSRSAATCRPTERLALFERRTAELDAAAWPTPPAAAADGREPTPTAARCASTTPATDHPRARLASTSCIERRPTASRARRHRVPSSPDDPPRTEVPTHEHRSVSPSPVSATAPARLVQGLEYYRDADPADDVPGLMHVELGGYHIRDIEVVAAFDVDADQGRPRRSARPSAPARTTPSASPTVGRARRRRCCGARPSTASASTTARPCEESPAEPVDVAQALRDAEADVLVSYLPGRLRGGPEALRPGLPRRRRRLRQRHPGVHRLRPRVGRRSSPTPACPIVGDDIKSQVGATIVHRILARLFEDRGMVLDRTYQLNVGGNMDFKNMLERERLESKKISKTQAVTSQIDNGHRRRRRAHRPVRPRRRGSTTASGPTSASRAATSATCRSTSSSSSRCGTPPTRPASSSTPLRCAKLALDRGIGGPLLGPSAYFMKCRRCSTTTTRPARWSRSSPPAPTDAPRRTSVH